MDEMKLRKTIIPYMNYICHLSQKQVFSNSFYQKILPGIHRGSPLFYDRGNYGT